LTPQPVKPAYLAFIGRISPEKGTDRAIRIAQRCGLPLKIAAKVDKADCDYFEQRIRPLLDSPAVQFIGEIGDAEKPTFLSAAVALLAPIDWPEPFGLVTIEAMACGTPVIAYNRGAVPEIVEDGVTGFVVEDEASAAAAVARAGSLSRPAIRARFEQRFTARRMAQEYLALYRELIEANELRRLAAARTNAARGNSGRRQPHPVFKSGRVSGNSSQTEVTPQRAMNARP
jgi:glycosyltransferase involved in cell wall biosynthesis